MQFTIKLSAPDVVGGAQVKAEAGKVDFNGVKLLPFEAAMIADALIDCAAQAESLARREVYASKYAAKADQPATAEL